MSVEFALLAVAVGVIVGVISALFGAGGGIIMVPFMVLILEKTQHVAEGTSLLVIVPTALAGVYAHRKAGYVAWRTLICSGSGGSGGSSRGRAHRIGDPGAATSEAVRAIRCGRRRSPRLRGTQRAEAAGMRRAMCITRAPRAPVCNSASYQPSSPSFTVLPPASSSKNFSRLAT